MFVVERMHANLLMKYFDEMTSKYFSAGLDELDPIKLNILSEAELNCIVEGNRKLYKDRIEDILSCRICNCYNVTDVGDILNSTPFQYLHYYYPVYLSEWKNHDLTKGNSEGCPNVYFVCGSILSGTYTDLYDYYWNLNGTVTKSIINKRCKR